MSAAQNDLHPLTDLAHVKDDRANSLIRVIAFAGDLLAPRQDAVGLAEIDDDRSTLETLDRPGDQVPALIFKFVVETIALGFANLLNDHLLGRLRRNAPEVDLPEARDAATTSAWIEAVLRGEAPVPDAIARQIETIKRIAKR